MRHQTNRKPNKHLEELEINNMPKGRFASNIPSTKNGGIDSHTPRPRVRTRTCRVVMEFDGNKFTKIKEDHIILRHRSQ